MKEMKELSHTHFRSHIHNAKLPGFWYQAFQCPGVILIFEPLGTTVVHGCPWCDFVGTTR